MSNKEIVLNSYSFESVHTEMVRSTKSHHMMDMVVFKEKNTSNSVPHPGGAHRVQHHDEALSPLISGKSSTCIFGVTSSYDKSKDDVTPVQFTESSLMNLWNHSYGDDVLTVAFDAEWQTYSYKNEIKRSILSYQFGLRHNDCVYLFLLTYNRSSNHIAQLENGVSEHLLAFKTVLGYVLGYYYKNLNSNLQSISANKYYEERRSIEDSKKSKTKVKNKISRNYLKVQIVSHAGKGDISSFYRGATGDHVFDPIRHVFDMQGGMISIKPVYLDLRIDRFYMPIALTFRDTLALTPATGKKLSDMSKSLGMEKILLDSEKIDCMFDLYLSDLSTFSIYALNDAMITLLYAESLVGKNRSLMLTSSACGEQILKAIIQKKNNWDEFLFDKILRGLILKKKGKRSINSRSGLTFIQNQRFECINYSAVEIFTMSGLAYSGGYNQCFTIGIEDESLTFDIDLKSAYPLAMSLTPDIDYERPSTLIIEKVLRKGDYPLWPFTPFYAHITFKFPRDSIPCIPIDEDGSLVFVREGTSYACAPEIWCALEQGAEIKIVRGIEPELRLDSNGNPIFSFSEPMKTLLIERDLLEKKYGKSSVQAQMLKTMANSIYGKTAQGIKEKNGFNSSKLTFEKMGFSSISLPPLASHTTSLVRSIIITTMFQLKQLGYKTFSATTDGFITNATIDVVRSLDLLGLSLPLKHALSHLNNSKIVLEMWECKHHQEMFLNFCSRGNVAPNLDGVCAHGGYITGYSKDSLEDRSAMIHTVLDRFGNTSDSFNKWTAFKDLAHGQDFSVIQQNRNLKLNFDGKQKIILETCIDKVTEFEGISYTHLKADTEPYESLEEYRIFKSSINSMDVIRSVNDVRVIFEAVDFNKNGLKKNGINFIKKWTDDENKARLLLTGYRSGLYSIPALDDFSGEQIISLLNNLSLGSRTWTRNDWKNAGRLIRQKSIPEQILIQDLIDRLNSINLYELVNSNSKAKKGYVKNDYKE